MRRCEMTCAPPARSTTRTPRIGREPNRPDGRPARRTAVLRPSERERPARTLFPPTLMQPERVDPPRGDPSPAPLRKRFEETLRARSGRPTRRPPAPPREQKTATARRPLHHGLRAERSPGEQRGLARREMDRAARQRLSDGQTASARATGRLEARTADLLRAALRTEEAVRTEHAFRVAPAAAGPFTPGTGEPPPVGTGVQAAPGLGVSAAVPGSEGRAERALALVERIERFVRSGRPSLALTLGGSSPGRLEVHRVARGAVSLRLSSARPPPASELRDLRQALEARGLSVRSLEVRASGADACSPSP
jgi:hypothetical protein